MHLNSSSNRHTVAAPSSWTESKPPRLAVLDGTLGLAGAKMKFARNTEIFGEDEAAEYVYKLLSGAVRTCKLLNDGRRQIAGFCFPGDYFGLEAGETHLFSAEAVSECLVLVIKRSTVEALAARDGQAARELWAMTTRSLQRAQEHMLLLGRKNAQERLVAFLLEMGKHSRTPGAIELPMSRQDIADYLGLTIETVSRTLTQLEGTSTIELAAARRVLVRDPSALKRLNG